MLSNPNIPDRNVPNDSEVAVSLGIDHLRVGRHFLRDESRTRIGAIWLDTLWTIHVQPSFDDHGLLGVAAAHGEDFHSKKSSGWIKAVLASHGSLVVQQLEADPLPPAVAGLPLLQKSNSMFLDGIGYELRFESIQIKGTLAFANPMQPELVAIETTCWHLANTMAHKSGIASLIAFTNTWRRYHEREA